MSKKGAEMTRRSFLGFLLVLPVLNLFKSEKEADVFCRERLSPRGIKFPEGNQWREMKIKKTTSVGITEVNVTEYTWERWNKVQGKYCHFAKVISKKEGTKCYINGIRVADDLFQKTWYLELPVSEYKMLLNG